MSTILKALEKLEREKDALRANGPLPVIGASGSAGGGPAGWYLKTWFWLGLVGIIIVVLGGMAWHFYRQSQENSLRLAERSSAVAPPPIQHSADGRDKTAPTRVPGAARPESRRPARAMPPAQMPEPGPARDRSALQQEQGTMQRGPTGISGSAIQRPATETALAAQVPAAMDDAQKVKALPAAAPVRPGTASKRNAPDDAYKNTPMLTDGRLRINAIAWSPRPVERMAVINSRIIHEGDSVEDFTVVVIRSDDVVVREKGKGVWRVEFGRP